MKSHMYNEIHEQPEVLATILDEEWGRVLSAARILRNRGFRFAMLAARGTSDNAALYAKYLFEILLGIPTALASPSTFTLYEGRMNLDDTPLSCCCSTSWLPRSKKRNSERMCANSPTRPVPYSLRAGGRTLLATATRSIW